MPVDPQMLDAMLGSFRAMVKDCREKKLSGDDFDQMESALNRMEELGQKMDDVGAFSGQLMQENLFMKFSDHYGKVLSAAARQSSINTSVYNEQTDRALQDQTINAYKDAIQRLADSKTDTKKILGDHSADADVLINNKIIIDAINKVIDKANQSGSYPQFLSALISGGLDKALEGSVISRESQVYSYESAKATGANPFYIKKEKEKLDLFDELGKRSNINIPDPLQYSLGCEKIEWKYEPDIRKWNKIKIAREKAAFLLDEWITSYCSFAASIEPWAQSANPKEAVIESQDCCPGKLRVIEKIYTEYYQYSLQDMFRHESFSWDVSHHWMYWSKEYMHFLLNEVEQVCNPFSKPPEILIRKAAGFHLEKKKVNPRITEPALRYARYFDSYFGAGEYEKRFGLPEIVETNAMPWE